MTLSWKQRFSNWASNTKYCRGGEEGRLRCDSIPISKWSSDERVLGKGIVLECPRVTWKVPLIACTASHLCLYPREILEITNGQWISTSLLSCGNKRKCFFLHSHVASAFLCNTTSGYEQQQWFCTKWQWFPKWQGHLACIMTAWKAGGRDGAPFCPCCFSGNTQRLSPAQHGCPPAINAPFFPVTQFSFISC